jgi:ABC-type transport system involved in multi-copper enzyme maturation permease subunit
MIAAVFQAETMRVARRGRHRRIFKLYTWVLLAEFLFLCYSMVLRAALGRDVLRAQAPEVLLGYFELFMGQTALLLILATPALAAGAIGDEKARGTLSLLLTTALSTGDIVLGKWLAHVVLILFLALPVTPLIVLLIACAGLPGYWIALWLAETLMLAMALAAATLLASVWTRRASAAALLVYLLCAALLAPRLYAAAPSPSLAGAARSSPAGLGALPATTAACLGLACWRLRPAHAAQLAGGQRWSPAPWLCRPPVSDAPLRWKERHAGELGLLTFLRRVPRAARLAAVACVGVAASLATFGNARASFAHGLTLILIPGLIVAVRASGIICAEREKKTWDDMLQSPLSTTALVRGKLWGVIDSVRPYLGIYLVPALTVAVCDGPWPVFCIVYSWLAAWALLYYLGANAVRCSAESAGSWQSLLRTVTSSARTMLGSAVLLTGFVTTMLSMALASIFATLLPAPELGAGLRLRLLPCLRGHASAPGAVRRGRDSAAGRGSLHRRARTMQATRDPTGTTSARELPQPRKPAEAGKCAVEYGPCGSATEGCADERSEQEPGSCRQLPGPRRSRCRARDRVHG